MRGGLSVVPYMLIFTVYVKQSMKFNITGRAVSLQYRRSHSHGNDPQMKSLFSVFEAKFIQVYKDKTRYFRNHVLYIFKSYPSHPSHLLCFRSHNYWAGLIQPQLKEFLWVSDCKQRSYNNTWPNDWAVDKPCVEFNKDHHDGTKKECWHTNSFFCEIPDSMYTIWLT